MIGELRIANLFLARAVARVRFYPAAVIPDQDEPVPLDTDGVTLPAGLADAAEEELARLPLDAGYRFVGVLTENLAVAGECWLHGYIDTAGEEAWEVLSVSEVILGQDGQMSIRRAGDGFTIPVDADAEEMLRVWVPHPRWGNLADSPMRSLQDVCEDIILSGRESRAVSRSRIASNGLFKIPRNLSLLLATRDDEITADDDSFMAELSAVLTAPIMNEGHPGAVAPAAIVGEAEDLKAFEHMRIDRESSADITERVEQHLARLGRGLDIPPEIITGIGEANHWSGWLIDSTAYRNHIDPSVRTVADGLTEAFFRPALIARGFSPADVRKVTVWRDAGVLTENPNRGQDAKDAFDRGAIGFKALATALGFSDNDAPTDDELIKMIALKAGVDTGTSALLLRAAIGTTVVPAAPQQPQPRVIEPAPDTPAAAPGQTAPGTPATATPGTAPDGITAAGRALLAAILPTDDDGYSVDVDGSRALGDIDRVLMDRVLVAAEEALQRALEKAGARIRGKLNGKTNAELRAAYADVPVTDMAARLGPEAVMRLGLRERELLADAFDRLATNWAAWVNAGIGEAVRVVLRMLGLTRASTQGQAVAERITTAMTGRVPGAWAWLHDQLLNRAEKVLYRPDEPPEGPGETSRFRVPAGLVRRALGMVGGTPDEADGATPVVPTGLGIGSTVSTVLSEHGAAQLGFEWLYGVTDRSTFEPHLDLDGERFSTWTDERLVPPTQYAWIGPYMYPGDHDGCQCAAQPVWIIPDPGTGLSNRRALADRVRAFRDRWLRRDRRG